MKTIIAALFATIIAGTADAYTSTRCYWIGSTYTCTTYGGGGVSTTRCTQIGTTVSCTSY